MCELGGCGDDVGDVFGRLEAFKPDTTMGVSADDEGPDIDGIEVNDSSPSCISTSGFSIECW